MEARRRTVQEHGPLLPEHKTPAVKLFEKPYSAWTKKQRKWLDMVCKRLFPSPRGRKAKKEYDSLFHEREMARAFGAKTKASRRKFGQPLIPSYTELASRAAGTRVSARPEDGDPARQRFIRAYQRRKAALRLPDPPQD